MRLTVSFLLAAALAAPVHAAINPAEYTRNVPYPLQLRPQVQIVQHSEVGGEKMRRTTIVATVVQEHRDVANIDVGETVTIDWTVNLDAQERARAAHDAEYGTMPGPQFLYAPLPPTLDADGLFWANLDFDEHAKPYPGLVEGAAKPAFDVDQRFGEILVPASHQYTWDRPEGAR